MLSKFKPSLFRREKNTTPSEKSLTPVEYTGPYDNAPIPRLTIHTAIMTILVSMGGFGESQVTSACYCFSNGV